MLRPIFFLFFLSVNILSFNHLYFISANTNCPLEVSNLQVLMVNKGNISIVTNNNIGQVGNASRIDNNVSEGPLSQKNEHKLVFTFKAKNISDQTIACFYWESRYLSAENKLMVKQIKSKKVIKPNKEIDIKETLPITNIMQLPQGAKLGYRVTKIEYEDKSVWEDSSNTDKGFVYINIKFEK
ncbi:MAG: hypothetical protein HY819_11095 [Acidobacteria bacterium]|nr:hypothetical protein [Acidobacteriota bacterium]